ncbi:hypothetical protein NE237_016535 [Protea cynaroides]|uniref:Uncharacterized protein n=1 Tax=Protea cynaroides TaxID=273540 RepID=A0A9Q0HDP5_9MAGN|nr:hypothetical protein NE237_016535 [Protea cynaroides]
MLENNLQELKMVLKPTKPLKLKTLEAWTGVSSDWVASDLVLGIVPMRAGIVSSGEEAGVPSDGQIGVVEILACGFLGCRPNDGLFSSSSLDESVMEVSNEAYAVHVMQEDEGLANPVVGGGTGGGRGGSHGGDGDVGGGHLLIEGMHYRQ